MSAISDRQRVICIISEIINYYENIDIISVDEVDKVNYIKKVLYNYENNVNNYSDVIGINSHKIKLKIINKYNYCKRLYDYNFESIDSDYMRYKFYEHLLNYIVLSFKGYGYFTSVDASNLTSDYVTFEMFNSVLFNEYDFYKDLFLSSYISKKIIRISNGSRKKMYELIRVCIDEYNNRVNNIENIDKDNKKQIISEINMNMKNLCCRR